MTLRDDAAIPVRAAGVPVVDLGGDPERVGRAVRAACRAPGFFYVSGHGVSERVVDATFDAARAFFALDDERKLEAHYDRTGRLRGYVPMRAEHTGGNEPGDVKEAFDFAPEYRSAVPETAPYAPRMRARNRWPRAAPWLRPAAEAYLDAMIVLGRRLFAAFARAVDLDANHFDAVLDEPIAEVRLLRYPRAPTSEAGAGLGIGAHCDSECLTVLAQRGGGGIDVRSTAGRWMLAPPRPGLFLVTIGDMLERWTNGVLPATPHRVRVPVGDDRYAIAFFFGPRFDAAIECLPTCRSPGRPPRFAPVVAGDYLVRRLAGNYGDQPRAT